MRLKKIRGHKHLWKKIDQWIENNKYLDLEHLKEYQKDYAKIGISPWNNISITNSTIPNPTGASRAKLMKGLIEIYTSWKHSLDALNQPYYLKIWLFDARFSKSQVVCAIGNEIDYYENLFYKDNQKNRFPFQTDVNLNSFNWKQAYDEDFLFESDLNDPEYFENKSEYDDYKIWFKKQLQQTHRKINIENDKLVFALKKGNVWLGNHSVK
jgi:hypothetical protein